ncbi:hypothetical protein JTE90_016495 [Oedothorax gibbosus]|uniref:Uncharacterized protein n=1 Tax=Oedothorax gibbosus TaxID=931172 RepID=A0AAV6U997_9ARAC|nr:hypothetical protein JTE90_016495 [Oedothorax gibbosus]
MAHLDDQSGRPAQQRFLDLSTLKPQTREEVQNALYKIPEMRLRPEKLPEDENPLLPDSWRRSWSYPYMNPVPPSMVHVKIKQLSKVDIDWKMLTLDRPETALEVHIFSRIVYLNKVTRKCIANEKDRKEKAQSVRLQRLGAKYGKVAKDGDSGAKIEDLTYECFSRHFGMSDRGQAMEEIPKPATADATKPPPVTTADDPNDDATAEEENIADNSTKRKTKVRKKKLTKKKKKSKKNKLRKRKSTRTGSPTKSSPVKSKVRKVKLKKSSNSVKSNKHKLGSSGKTLVQMLKVSEKAERRQRKVKL